MTRDPQELRFEAAKLYAALMMKGEKQWTIEETQFVLNYRAHLAWVTNGKGIA